MTSSSVQLGFKYTDEVPSESTSITGTLSGCDVAEHSPVPNVVVNVVIAEASFQMTNSNHHGFIRRCARSSFFIVDVC